MGAQDGPQIVLAKVSLGDQRRSRMSTELRQLATDTRGHLSRQVASLREERNQRLAIRTGGGCNEVTITEQDAANASGVLERQCAGVAGSHHAREGAHGVTRAKRCGDLELRRLASRLGGASGHELCAGDRWRRDAALGW